MSIEIHRQPVLDPRVTEAAEQLIACLQAAIAPGPDQAGIVTVSGMLAVRNVAAHLLQSDDDVDLQLRRITASVLASLVFGHAEIIAKAFIATGADCPPLPELRRDVLASAVASVIGLLQADVRATSPAPSHSPKKEAF